MKTINGMSAKGFIAAVVSNQTYTPPVPKTESARTTLPEKPVLTPVPTSIPGHGTYHRNTPYAPDYSHPMASLSELFAGHRFQFEGMIGAGWDGG